MQQIILTIVLLFSSLVVVKAQGNNKNLEERNVTVTVVNALNDTGSVNFALFNEEGFRKQPLFAKSGTIENGVSSIVFEKIPKGEYAIICYHDENENNKMDFDVNGMPKESYGTSNNVILMGPPNYETSKFEIMDKDLTLEIKF
ncbi:DUF2141 domain-containing protein [Lutibacter sp.]|uniref:DUF2141 domain-containing protein n=1 Tax=Lutibacter sp. TaxID=1925666 RepID=UPI003567D532